MFLLGKYKRLASQIDALRPTMQALSDEELKNKTAAFKGMLKNGSTLNAILVEAFAVVREASRRVLGMEPYIVQLIGGCCLFDGNIAEMCTGEGKTLVAALPSYLHALTGKGVHVVTVNDYLVKRDAEQIGQVHQFLGLSVGMIQHEMEWEERKAAYACDITYVTNTELGFDYLRDNMVASIEQKVLRGLHYAIIDEVDSILIDEARTPLIISRAGKDDLNLFRQCDDFVARLRKGEVVEEDRYVDRVETGDYIVDEKEKTVSLTAEGIAKAEKYFKIDNYSDTENSEIQHCVLMALKAHALMHKDKDYIIQDNEIAIVDEHTGRVLSGRRYSDGLHQAIEAKEHVEVKQRNVAMATITFQHFFNKFEIKSGMTGTAMTEKDEFKDIYHMRVLAIPTNRPVVRQDLDDIVYLTKKGKYRAVVNAVKEAHAKGQPVLVGTTTVETSELLHRALTREGIAHSVLNAKYHEKEAEIISHAGEKGSVTIATNMAGRGTDIKLDAGALEAGGLLVIGTERHDARRIDNQLRGRSGRQGDPGASRFYLSIEDDLMRLYGKEELIERFKNMGITEDTPIMDGMLTKAITQAQKRVEAQHYSIRKSLLDYDDVNNKQREIIYAERDSLLAKETMGTMIPDLATTLMEEAFNDYYFSDYEKFCQVCKHLFGQSLAFPKVHSRDEAEKLREALHTSLGNYIRLHYDEFLGYFPSDDSAQKSVQKAFLQIMDQYWVRHIDSLEHLREGISLQSIGQHDPKIEYNRSAYEMFDKTIADIRSTIIYIIYNTRPVNVPGTQKEVAS